MGKKYLFSPIGNTDPIKYLYDGSMLHICRYYKPDVVYLYLSKEMAENHDLDISVELNLESVITTFIEISPRSIRYLIKKESAKSMTNPVHSAEKILGIYYRQNIWLLFQGVFFIAFILCAVVFI